MADTASPIAVSALNDPASGGASPPQPTGSSGEAEQPASVAAPTAPEKPIVAVKQDESPDYAQRIAEARAQGASWDEINSAFSDKRAQAKAAGVTDQEFNDAVGLPQPPSGQQYFTFKDIAQNSSRAFIDYPEAAFDALKKDWNRQFPQDVPPTFWASVKQRYDSAMATGKIPLDLFNLAMSPLAATWGAIIARPLSGAETDLTAAVKNALTDKITDPDMLKAWQSAAENDINTTLLALGPEGDELQLGARAKAAPVIQSKDTLDAAASVVGHPDLMKDNLATVANNLHDNWVKTGEEPIAAAQRALTDPDFKTQLRQPAIEPPVLDVLPEKQEPANPKPTEVGDLINPQFGRDHNGPPELVEDVAPDLGAKVAGTDAFEPIKGVSDFKDLFMKDPVQAGKVAATYIRDSVFPPLASPEAMEAALTSRKFTGEANRATAIVQSSLNSVWRSVANMDQADKYQFIDYMENNLKTGVFRGEGAAGAQYVKPLKLPGHLQVVADMVRGMYKDAEEKLKLLPNQASREFVEYYFTHNWKDSPLMRGQMARYQNYANISRAGSVGVLKDRILPTHEEGRFLGLEDRYNHPLETVLNNITNTNRLVSHFQAMAEMETKGYAQRFIGGKDDPVPKGWVKLDGPFTNDIGDGQGVIFARPEVARIYNNSISTGFTGVQGEVFKVVNGISNALRQLKLGTINFYHGSTTIISAMLRQNGLAIGELGTVVSKIKEGDLLGAADSGKGAVAKILSSPIAPIKYFFDGMKGLKEYKVPGSTDPQTQNLIDLLTKANSVTAKMPDYMREGAYRDMWDSWQRGDYDNFSDKAVDFMNGLTWKNAPIQIPVAVAKGVSSFMSTTMRPVFDVLVPNVKTGAAMGALKQWMTDHPNASFGEHQAAAAQIGDSMDNLFGEMMRDNLFWHKQAEQAVNLGFLSYGWILGELRGMAGGIKDIATLQNTSNAQNVIGFITTMALLNSTYQYLHTGKAPETVRDVFFPQTSGKQKAGGETVPERAELPGHTSQLAHYQDNFFHEMFGAEANPIFGVAGLLTTGKNWAAYDAYNRNGDFFEKSQEFSKALWDEIGPISVQTWRLGPKSGSALTPLERMAGVRQAPQFEANPGGVEKQTQARQARAWGSAQKFQKRMDQSYHNPDSDENQP